MNTARAGKIAEAKVIAELAHLGYMTVQAHLSRGEVDLVALKPGTVLGVQVKRQRTPEPAEWNAILDWCERAGVTPVVAFAPPRQDVSFHLLVGRKDGRGGRQPWLVLSP